MSILVAVITALALCLEYGALQGTRALSVTAKDASSAVRQLFALSNSRVLSGGVAIIQKRFKGPVEIQNSDFLLWIRTCALETDGLHAFLYFCNVGEVLS